jgi:carboxymethylenebutenolidase
MVHWAVTPGSATETVTIVSDGFPTKAFLAKPTHLTELIPALVLLHEWWGLNNQTREWARRLASEGYVVLAPDLYSRQGNKVTTEPQEATVLMNALSSQRALRDLNASTTWLRSQKFVDPLRVGMIGFSMGATLALNQAGHNSDVKAAVAFYGKVPLIESFRYLLCPIMFHHAGKDGWVTRQEVERLAQGFEQQGKPGVIHVYPEAEHGFMSESRPEVYHAKDAELAWNRTLAFLGAHVR